MLPRSIEPDSKWRKRINRVWIALFLPIAVLFGYLALDHHVAANGIQDDLRRLNIRQTKRENELFGIPQIPQSKQAIIERRIESYASKDGRLKEFRSSGDYLLRKRSREEEYRDGYIAKSILAVVIPAILLFFYRFIMWLWHGDEKKAQ